MLNQTGKQNMKSVIKFILPVVSSVIIAGCAGLQLPHYSENSSDVRIPVSCPGTIELPFDFLTKLDEVFDEAMLESALGKPEEGKLCQGKVYQIKENSTVTLYRAWNSTNENSRLGQWWAFTQPAGKVAQYRSQYEICYQWSPLDKMTQCNFKAGSKIVIGTGQSAKCSEYLSYPASPELQIYIEDVKLVSTLCKDFDGFFKWIPIKID